MSLLNIAQLPPLPARPPGCHKGTFGKALVVAGSRGMSGAACLAGVAALRAGAGLVTVAAPAGIVPIIAGYEPSYLTVPLAEDGEGRIGNATETVLGACEHATAAAIGPGWGRSSDLELLALRLYADVSVPLVVDADALNALAAQPEKIEAQPKGPRVLTPHPGEFGRLINRPTAEVQAHREMLATQFALERGVVLVLKGEGTVITDGRRLAVNSTGNSGMATGGTGDVLTGIITALLAQGLGAFEAAQLGAHVHGLAGDLAAADMSQPGLIASDLLHYLARAWRQLQ